MFARDEGEKWLFFAMILIAHDKILIEINAGNGGGTNHRAMCQSRVGITWVG